MLYGRRKKELTKKEINEILENIDRFEKNWNFEVSSYAITGGDPFLYSELEFLFSELRKRNKKINLMGNPDTLTIENINLMKKYNIKNFQMSLDGLEEKHDYIRGKGSYQLTLEKADLLKQNGISVNIMFTVNKYNYVDLIPLMKIISLKQIDSFSFDFLCSIGNAKELSMLEREESEKLLKNYLKEKEKMIKQESNTFFHEKNALFRKIRKENNNFPLQMLNEASIYTGCYIGFTSFAISSDGYFMPCRRLGEKYESLLKVSLEDIFLGNEELKKYRRKSYYFQCGSCDLFKFCRGCPAIVKGETGTPFGKLYLCSKEEKIELKKESINTTKEEERKIVEEHIENRFAAEFENIIKTNKDYQDLLLMLIFERKQLLDFLKEPEKILEELKYKFNKKEFEMLLYFLELFHMGIAPNLIEYIFGGLRNVDSKRSC